MKCSQTSILMSLTGTRTGISLPVQSFSSLCARSSEKQLDYLLPVCESSLPSRTVVSKGLLTTKTLQSAMTSKIILHSLRLSEKIAYDLIFLHDEWPYVVCEAPSECQKYLQDPILRNLIIQYYQLVKSWNIICINVMRGFMFI